MRNTNSSRLWTKQKSSRALRGKLRFSRPSDVKKDKAQATMFSSTLTLLILISCAVLSEQEQSCTGFAHCKRRSQLLLHNFGQRCKSLATETGSCLSLENLCIALEENRNVGLCEKESACKQNYSIHRGSTCGKSVSKPKPNTSKDSTKEQSPLNSTARGNISMINPNNALTTVVAKNSTENTTNDQIENTDKNRRLKEVNPEIVKKENQSVQQTSPEILTEKAEDIDFGRGVQNQPTSIERPELSAIKNQHPACPGTAISICDELRMCRWDYDHLNRTHRDGEQHTMILLDNAAEDVEICHRQIATANINVVEQQRRADSCMPALARQKTLYDQSLEAKDLFKQQLARCLKNLNESELLSDTLRLEPSACKPATTNSNRCTDYTDELQACARQQREQMELSKYYFCIPKLEAMFFAAGVILAFAIVLGTALIATCIAVRSCLANRSIRRRAGEEQNDPNVLLMHIPNLDVPPILPAAVSDESDSSSSNSQRASYNSAHQAVTVELHAPTGKHLDDTTSHVTFASFKEDSQIDDGNGPFVRPPGVPRRNPSGAIIRPFPPLPRRSNNSRVNKTAAAGKHPLEDSE